MHQDNVYSQSIKYAFCNTVTWVGERYRLDFLILKWEISKRDNGQNKLFTYWLVVVFQAHHSSTQARKTIMGTNTVMVDKVLQKAWTSNITLMVISHNVNFPILYSLPIISDTQIYWMSNF